MKKTAAILLLFALLLTGCGSRAAAPAPTPTPEAEPVTPSPVPATSAPTTVPTPEPTPTPEPPQWVRQEESTDYILYVGLSAPAGALGSWLLSEGAALAGEYRPAQLEESMFALLSAPRETPQIPAAGEERIIRLAAEQAILDSGLLGALLPAFESRYGYAVEVYSGRSDEARDWASADTAEVLLLSRATAALINRRGFASVNEFVSTSWVLE